MTPFDLLIDSEEAANEAAMAEEERMWLREQTRIADSYPHDAKWAEATSMIWARSKRYHLLPGKSYREAYGDVAN